MNFFKRHPSFAALIAIAAGIIQILLFPPRSISSTSPAAPSVCTADAASTQTSYAEEVWIAALEWCESRGNPKAVNAKDRDGTASYYSFQFKPETFRNFAERYQVIPKGKTNAEIRELMKDTGLQRQIVRFMIKDPSVNLTRQFPDCINKKIGPPPKY